MKRLCGVAVLFVAAIGSAGPGGSEAIRIAPNVIYDPVRSLYVVANDDLVALDHAGKVVWTVAKVGHSIGWAGGMVAVAHPKAADYGEQVVDFFDPADGKSVASCGFTIPKDASAQAETGVFQHRGKAYARWLRRARPVAPGGVPPTEHESFLRKQVERRALACGVVRLAVGGGRCKATAVGFESVGLEPCSGRRPYLGPLPGPGVDLTWLHVGIEQRDAGSTAAERKVDRFLVVRDEAGGEQWRHLIASSRHSTLLPPTTVPAAPPPPPPPPPSPTLPAIPAGKGIVFGEVVASHDAISYSHIPRHAIRITGAARATVRTDAKGHYSIALAPGSYVLTTKAPRIAPNGDTTARVVVVAGQRVQIDFRFNDGTRCLDGLTPIATPGGGVPVRDLRPGDRLWVCDVDGRPRLDRVSATQVVKAPGLAVRLESGLVVAPGHLLADGSRPDELSTERVSYGDARSYDLTAVSGRPYWAGGVALWSTMQPAGASIRCAAPP